MQVINKLKRSKIMQATNKLEITINDTFTLKTVTFKGSIERLIDFLYDEGLVTKMEVSNANVIIQENK